MQGSSLLYSSTWVRCCSQYSKPVHAYRIVSSGAQAITGRRLPRQREKPLRGGVAVPGCRQVKIKRGSQTASPEPDHRAGAASALAVSARTTTFAYKGRTVTTSDIRRELRVDFIGEGSVRLAKQPQGHVQLMMPIRDRMPGLDFDRSFSDVLRSGRNRPAIVSSCASIWRSGCRSARRDPTTSPTTYYQLLRALAAWRGGSERDAIELLTKAIRIDPNYARALAQLAFHYSYSRVSQSATYRTRNSPAGQRLVAEALAAGRRVRKPPERSDPAMDAGDIETPFAPSKPRSPSARATSMFCGTTERSSRSAASIRRDWPCWSVSTTRSRVFRPGIG